MAIISVGYDGAVSESQWSEMIKKVGSSEYGVVGLADWKVTNVTAADRTIQIGPGKGWGHGVFDENTATVQVQLDPVASGTRWDLIAMRRDWTGVGGSSTFVKVNGTSAKEIPVGRTKGPGVIDDQPIALVQVTAGQTNVTAILDLRVWSSNGGMTTVNDLALTYLDSLGTSVRTTVNGKPFHRIVGWDGNPMWTVGAPDGNIPAFGIGTSLAGGLNPDNNLKVQAGTITQAADAAGYARVTFPQQFPNGLLYVSGSNGDDWATGGGAVAFASAGSAWGNDGYGTRSTWVYSVLGQASPGASLGRLPHKLHRINWLALGW